MCVGCKGEFSSRRPAHYVCYFSSDGFPFRMHGFAQPCGTAYHRGCIFAGEPFRTRLRNGKGLTMPYTQVEPTFICELCQVRAMKDQELRGDAGDIQLLMLERMRMIDCRSGWKAETLTQYGGKLKFLRYFGLRYGVSVLEPTQLQRPPVTPAVSLQWAQLAYSLRTSRTGDRIKASTVRQLRSAASMYYLVDTQVAYPRRALRDGQRRTQVTNYVSPTDESTNVFAQKGIERRLGHNPQASWALSFTHIAFLDAQLGAAFCASTDLARWHDLAIAGSSNLMFYLGWLRGGELYAGEEADLCVTPPADGASKGLPPGIGVIEFNLLQETKSDPCRTADVVIAWTTLSGLSLGMWLTRLATFESFSPGLLFSSALHPQWSSRIFREVYAWPLLELQRAAGEPTLRCFSDTLGNRLQDKIYSMHSWRRAGDSRASRHPRHNEPNPTGTRRATTAEIYEHGRWELKRRKAAETMPAHYRHWLTVDRVALTLFCQ
jgi:hypothetical protein